MKFLFLLLVLALPFSARAEKKDYQNIQSYTTDKASQSYVVLGQIAEKARSDEACVRQMAKKAAKKGGDALIKVESNPTGAQGMWFGENVLHCKAIVVRWAAAGEKGISQLDAKTPIPFLFK